VVLPLYVLDTGAFDAEDRHPPAVHAPDLDLTQLAPADEPESPQEEVLGLKHIASRATREHPWTRGGEFG